MAATSNPERNGQVEQRLAEAGWQLPAVVAPVAAYVPALRDGHHVFTSGQIPMVEGKLPVTGKVGEGAGCVSPQEATDLARICALNALAAVKSVVGDLDQVAQVVKVVGYVAADPAFTAIPAVVNGASELLQLAFGASGRHARSAVGVAVLPLDAPVEVEVVVSLRQEDP